MDVVSTNSVNRQPPSWMARCAAALTMTVAFWFVGHSISESKRLVQESELGAGRVQNRYAVQQKETTMTSVIGYFLIGGMGAVLWMRSPPKELNWRHALMLCCLLYVGWNFTSLLWSVDAMQSIRKLAILGLMLAGVYGLAARFTMEDLIWVAILSITGLVVVAVLAEIAYGTFRPWRHDYRFTGTCHPNDQGLQCALLVLLAGFAEFAERDRPWVRRLLMGIGLLGLAMSKSRTTLVAFVAAAAIALLLRSHGMQRWLVATGCIAVLCVGGILSSFITVSAANETASIAAMGRQQHLSSLTGRLPLWKELWKAAEERLVIGHGMGAFWNEKNVLKYSKMFGWHIPHAHNAYLDLILQVGLIGLLTHVIWLIATAAAALARYDRDQRPAELFVVSFMAFELVHSISESKLPGSGEAGFMMLAVMCMVAVQMPRLQGASAAALAEPLGWPKPREWRRPVRRAFNGSAFPRGDAPGLQ
jgi:exopolysaccharide production protein ExoQ